MTAPRFHTWGNDPHRSRVTCEARRRHIHGPVHPMDEARPSIWQRLTGRG